MTEGRHQDGPTGLARSSRNVATLRAQVGSSSMRMRVQVSPRGLLALAGLLSCTLLSTAVIVAVATRKLPQGAMPARMKRSRW